VRLPVTTAPQESIPSSKTSALRLESLNWSSCLLGVSPLKNHSNSASPPSPRGSSLLSFGPAM
jgi:hypothetical protein